MRYLILFMVTALYAGCRSIGGEMEIEPLYVYAGRDSVNHEQFNNFIVSHFCYCDAVNFIKTINEIWISFSHGSERNVLKCQKLVKNRLFLILC